MFVPDLCARIKQRDFNAGLRIGVASFGVFETVAVAAG
jgi:hypothetical protein